MKRFLAAIALLCLLSGRSAAEDAAPANLRVFVCAHSFMIYTAKMLPPMAQAAGIPYTSAGEQMIGGSRVIQHWELPDDKNKAKAALRAGSVDVLTLSPHSLMPDPGIDNFTKLGFEKNPKLRVLIQASWPAFDGLDAKRPGPGQLDRNAATLESLRELHLAQNAGWRAKIEAQARALNTALGAEVASVIPVNDAVFTLRERVVEGKAPGIAKQSDLFIDDLGHPAPALAQLVTYCHFAAIFKRTPVGLPVPAAYKNVPQVEDLNKLLQEIAWEAVSTYRPADAQKP